MKLEGKSIRTFIGSKDFELSRKFYVELGFKEIILSEKMSYFYANQLGFYLQDYFLKDWVENSMVFLEVKDLEATLKEIENLNLPNKYAGVKLSKIHENEWGDEFFLHDPAGILWHFGRFN
ncbi:glyoxalase [Algoriphagus sp. oki45]|uniref:glyoxalase n=1 Tax=Algoriphagus sp. oki45 TaxID=3067294 RepID=UPI0027EC5805|nr:glyoxalase [Algoriphagus sp. oki45]